MIVKYVGQKVHELTSADLYLTIGKNYIVIDITYNPHSMIHNVNVPSDSDGEPIVLDANLLIFVDEKVPTGWVFRKLENGYFDLQPQEFCGNFWDNFHDGDEKAEKIYQEVVNNIYTFHGMDPFYKEAPTKREPLKDHEWWKEYLEDESGES